jgi:nucleotide-binding universal stress UspA family protein
VPATIDAPRGPKEKLLRAVEGPAGVLETGKAPAPPIRRVLCPIDFSDFSRAAALEAIELARACGAEITALFVFPIPSAWMGTASVAFAEPDSAVKSVVAQDLAFLFAPAREAGVRVVSQIETGEPARLILEAAEKMRADVIVMGTHGRSGFERWVLGSTTDKVLRKAPCPVFTVSRPAEGPTAGTPALHGILCAIDLSESSGRTVSYALSLGRSTGAPVALLHVLEGAIAMRGRTLLEAEARERLREVVEAAGGLSGPVEQIVVAGKAYREILRVAEERHSALVVMGVHGRTPAGGSFFGSTADHVVRQALVPVLTVRAIRSMDAEPSPSER